MTRIAPAWLRAPSTRRILNALRDARPLFVGGCVRDALMGRETADIDICVVSSPQETMTFANNAGVAAHPTGVDHGVVTLIADGAAFEVATLRRDVETDGRRAIVAYTTDIAEDAARRDFTLNALYANSAGEVVDPLAEGLADLAARRIRFIGDASLRIREDYLRILRFFRFHAQFGVTAFDERGLAACDTLAPGLGVISKERIGVEMLKLLAAEDPEPALAAMGAALQVAAPGARFKPGLTTIEREFGLAPSALRRLAALAPETPDTALRLSRDDARRLARIETARALSPQEAAYRYGATVASDALALNARDGAHPDDPRRILEQDIPAAADARFPVTAKDLMAAGLEPGPNLGAVLHDLETQWIRSDFTLDRDALIASQSLNKKR